MEDDSLNSSKTEQQLETKTSSLSSNAMTTTDQAARQQDVSDDLNAHWQAAKDEESEEKQKMGEALLEEIKNLKAELVQLQQRWDEEDATRELLEIDVSMEQD